MKINEMFPSSYWRGDDLKDGEKLVRMSHVEMREFKTESGAVEHKPVLYFMDEEKGLALNQINASTIGDRFGPDSELWRGNQIVMHHARVPFGSKIVDAVRIRTPPRDNEQQEPQKTSIIQTQPLPNGNGNGNGHATEAPAFGQHDEIPF